MVVKIQLRVSSTFTGRRCKTAACMVNYISHFVRPWTAATTVGAILLRCIGGEGERKIVSSNITPEVVRLSRMSDVEVLQKLRRVWKVIELHLPMMTAFRKRVFVHSVSQ